MSTQARNRTLRQVASHAEVSARTSLAAVTAAGQVAREFRAFAEMTGWQRVVWIVTGRGPHRPVPVGALPVAEVPDALSDH